MKDIWTTGVRRGTSKAARSTSPSPTGPRLDAVDLVSAGRGRTATVWVYTVGIDVFVPRSHVIDARESAPARAA